MEYGVGTAKPDRLLQVSRPAVQTRGTFDGQTHAEGGRGIWMVVSDF
jgi:hypothetical protein